MAARAGRNKFDRDDDWKATEDKVIKELYKTKTDRQMGKTLGRTARAVQWRRLELNFKKGDGTAEFWTDEEVDILTDKYKNFTVRQIANDFLPNKTISQIKDKARRMRFSKSKWTDEELDLLVEYGGKLSAKEIAKQFVPNKTPDQIRAKVLKGLGISRRKYLKEQRNAMRN